MDIHFVWLIDKWMSFCEKFWSAKFHLQQWYQKQGPGCLSAFRCQGDAMPTESSLRKLQYTIIVPVLGLSDIVICFACLVIFKSFLNLFSGHAAWLFRRCILVDEQDNVVGHESKYNCEFYSALCIQLNSVPCCCPLIGFWDCT